MLICYVCKVNVSNNLKGLFEHLKKKHGISGRHARYNCCQDNCCRTFGEKYVFTKHVARCHMDDMLEFLGHVDSGLNMEVDNPNEQNDLSFGDVDQVLDDSVENSCNDIDVTELASYFICEAKGQIATLSSVHTVINACQNMFEILMDDIKYALDVSISNKSTTEDFKKVFKKLELYRNPFKGLETEYSQTKYFERIGIYIKPESYTIDNRQTFTTDKTTGFKKPVLEQITGQYISIHDTIHALHARTDLITLATKSTSNTCCQRYESFFDGLHWAQHPLRNDDTIVIRLYGDDFEPANPLGSRKTVYKIGCIYYQFENLPSYILSKTENMFLALCYYTDDVKQFGWRKVFSPLLSALKSLESKGIELQVSGVLKTFKVVVSAITGDNLFLNGVLGFVECFTASHPCRHCVVHRQDFQKSFVEVSESLRSVESYDSALSNASVQESGIKQVCVLNELKYFHAVENYIQDPMHDILEGQCAYDIPLICNALVKKGYLDLFTLNHRLQSFDYGYYDSSNKVPVITSLDVEMLSFDASQMWCVTRILSLAIGDLVREDDEIWNLYLLLRIIIDIIFAPSVSDSDLQLLCVIIAEYLELRKNLFPAFTLKNKHHHLIHYPRLIRKVGPLYRFWCMRFESKHQRCKRILHITGNFKNILQTCANRHQHEVAFRLLKRTSQRDSDVIVGTGSVIVLSDLADGIKINDCLSNVGMLFELYQANWVEVKGIRYKLGCYILAKMNDDNSAPVFMHLENIFVRDHGDKMWFHGEKLKTKVFDTHYHSWLVERILPKKYICINPMELFYFFPLMKKKVLGVEEDLGLIGLRYRI